MAQDRTIPPTSGDLKQLPRWARVAFTARCARRVQPLFRQYWPDAPQVHVNAVDEAIALAETSARNGRDETLLREAAARAIEAANSARSARSAYVARAAAHAANAARAYADRAITRSAAAAIAVAADAILADFEQMWADYDHLRVLARRQRWTDESPVDPGILGDIIPDQYSASAYSQVSRSDEAAASTGVAAPLLRIRIEPGMASEQQIAALLENISELFVAAGGCGLRFEVTDGQVFAAALRGVPR